MAGKILTRPHRTALAGPEDGFPFWYTPSEDLLAKVRQESMTVASLKTQGAKELSTRELETLIVNQRVKVRNMATDSVFDAFYRPDGERVLTNLTGFAGFNGGLGGVTTPYTIENNMLSLSFDDGSKFSSRVYKLGDKYYGAKSDEARYVNYVAEAIE